MLRKKSLFSGNTSLLVVLPLAFFLASSAGAADWQSLVQPLGTLLGVESAATVNTRLGGKPPFDSATDVTTIATAAPLYFVRFYNPNATENPSNAIGSWVMRSATVRGLTAAQVRERFALPAMPTMMTMVLAPADSRMYTGIAAPIAGWGAGGGQQSKLIGPPWVPAENFINQQALGDCVLCYRTLATQGNAHRVATYLDARIPSAYSDLENVYNQLDLQYFPANAARFSESMEQISPLRYDHLLDDARRASLMFGEASDRRLSARLLGRKAFGLTQESGAGQEGNAWVQLAGNMQKAQGGRNEGFNTQAGGVFAGVDRYFSEQVLLGVAAGVVRSDLDWGGNSGGVRTDYFQLGAHATALYENWMLNGGLGLGVSRGEASRRIDLPALSRTAKATPEGQEGNARLNLAYRLSFAGVDVLPAASVDYFVQRRSTFSERGADSLNLQLDAAKNRLLRQRLGVEFSWERILPGGQRLAPQVQLGWVRDRSLGNRALTARLADQPDSFAVYGDTTTKKAVAASAGVELLAGPDCRLFALYALEYRRDLTVQSFSAGVSYRF